MSNVARSIIVFGIYCLGFLLIQNVILRIMDFAETTEPLKVLACITYLQLATTMFRQFVMS